MTWTPETPSKTALDAYLEHMGQLPGNENQCSGIANWVAFLKKNPSATIADGFEATKAKFAKTTDPSLKSTWAVQFLCVCGDRLYPEFRKFLIPHLSPDHAYLLHRRYTFTPEEDVAIAEIAAKRKPGKPGKVAPKGSDKPGRPRT